MVRRQITDPLDPNVNTFPDWFASRLQELHRYWLRKVLPHFGNDKAALAVAIAQYNECERRDAGVFGLAVAPNFPIEEFRQLAHNRTRTFRNRNVLPISATANWKECSLPAKSC
jgi:hypothetical protein